MSRKSRRHELAAVIATAAVDRLAVFPSPPDTITSPSVVIGPARPYEEQDAFCRFQMRLRLTLTVPRAAGSEGLDQLDEALDAIRDVITADLPAWSWLQVEQAGQTLEMGGSQHYTAAVLIERQT